MTSIVSSEILLQPAQRRAARTRSLRQQLDRRIAFRVARRLSHQSTDRQAMPIVHQAETDSR